MKESRQQFYWIVNDVWLTTVSPKFTSLCTLADELAQEGELTTHMISNSVPVLVQPTSPLYSIYHAGDQASIGKGDLWKLDLNTHFGVPSGRCIRKSDIRSVAIEEDGNDGWLIDSVVTVIKKQRDDEETLTIDLDVEQWIDGDGNPSQQRSFH